MPQLVYNSEDWVLIEQFVDALPGGLKRKIQNWKNTAAQTLEGDPDCRVITLTEAERDQVVAHLRRLGGRAADYAEDIVRLAEVYP